MSERTFDQTAPTTIQLESVPRELYPNHSWLDHGNNRDALRIWLGKHNIDIIGSYSIEFRNNGFSTVHFLRDNQGKLVVKEQGHAVELAPAVDHDYLPGLKPRLLREGRVREG